MFKTSYKSVVAVAVALVMSLSAAAQVHFGPKLGVAIDKLSFSKEALNSDNRAGFTGGLTMEVMLPVANLGFDISAMYVHRTTDIVGAKDEIGQGKQNKTSSRDYFEIPVNLKWKLGMPIVGRIITPYVFTGPSFAFLTSKKSIENAFNNRTFDVAWNFGIGLQFINKIQVGASYGLGMTKAVKVFNPDTNAANIEGKNRYWTVTAAYFF